MCQISHELSDQMAVMFNKKGSMGDIPLRMPSKKGFQGLNQVQQQNSERVVHVHQYFNTYTMPQGGQ